MGCEFDEFWYEVIEKVAALDFKVELVGDVFADLLQGVEDGLEMSNAPV